MAPGAEYSLGLSLLAWLFVALQIFLYTLTVFPGLLGTHFIFWHALHPVVPLALASAAWHGRWGVVWTLAVVAVVSLIEVAYLVRLCVLAAGQLVTEHVWLLVGSLGFLLVLGSAVVALVHRYLLLGPSHVPPGRQPARGFDPHEYYRLYGRVAPHHSVQKRRGIVRG